LINAAGLRGYPRSLRLMARAVLRPLLLTTVLPPAAPRILGHMFHCPNAHTRQFERHALDPVRRPALAAIARTFHQLAPELLRPTIADNAHRLTMPVQVIWGARDRLVPLATVERVTRSFPDGRLHVIAECGHMPIIEHPHETIAVLEAFLATEVTGRHAA
jgi:pimeloyl-ACP methyl ester carboxylesterase